MEWKMEPACERKAGQKRSSPLTTPAQPRDDGQCDSRARAAGREVVRDGATAPPERDKREQGTEKNKKEGKRGPGRRARRLSIEAQTDSPTPSPARSGFSFFCCCFPLLCVAPRPCLVTSALPNWHCTFNAAPVTAQPTDASHPSARASSRSARHQEKGEGALAAHPSRTQARRGRKKSQEGAREGRSRGAYLLTLPRRSSASTSLCFTRYRTYGKRAGMAPRKMYAVDSLM